MCVDFSHITAVAWDICVLISVKNIDFVEIFELNFQKLSQSM